MNQKLYPLETIVYLEIKEEKASDTKTKRHNALNTISDHIYLRLKSNIT